MGQADFYKSGDFNAICDLCGMKYKASKLKKTWDNKYNCRKCWEPKHPQYSVKGVKDDLTTPFVRAEPTDTFI